MEKTKIYYLALGHLCCDMCSGALPGLLPFFVTLYGMDYKLAAGLMFAGSVFSSIVQPLVGYLADKKPRSWFMSFGTILCGFSLALTGFLDNYAALFVAVALMGIGNAIFHPDAAQLVNKISGGRKGFGMSIFSTGGTAGYCMGPVVAVAITSAVGIHGTAFFGLLALIYGTVLFVKAPAIKALAAEKASLAAQGASKINLPTGTNDWSNFSRLTCVIIIRSAAYTALLTFLPLYCIHYLGQAEATGSATITILAAAGIITNMIGGMLGDRLGHIRIVRLCMALFALMLLILSHAGSIFTVYAILLPLGFACFASMSPTIVLGQTYLAKNIGFASGVTLGIAFSAGGVIAPILGIAGDTYGLPFVFEIAVALTALGTVMTFFLKEPRKKAPQPAKQPA